MAVIQTIVDDIDGTDDAETRRFSVDGVDYEIDLSDDNAEELRDALEPFVTVARRVGGKGKRKAAAAASPNGVVKTANGGVPNARLIRQWCAREGIDVNAKGRIPTGIAEQYAAANK